MSARPRTPPTTAPAMTPAWSLEEEDDDDGAAVGEEVVPGLAVVLVPKNRSLSSVEFQSTLEFEFLAYELVSRYSVNSEWVSYGSLYQALIGSGKV